ncbi:FkbM family methyltransferase [Desulfovibrio sp. OttesenSCG-928-M16]|nr:FkbM family methyltransferase [Desulfovibrio sp. OttesenSCG-928-M16]
MVRPGDVVIDAGVSRNCRETFRFAKLVGETGRIFSFEPEPEEFLLAQSQIEKRNLKQVKMVEKGLWSKNEDLFITKTIESSRVVHAKRGNVSACSLTSLDIFVEENDLHHVDVIKYDIEGAEMEALAGAETTIRKFKPVLIICLYHYNEDIYSIPIFLHQMNLSYKFYIKQGVTRATGTILFAIPPRIYCNCS